MGQLSDLDEGIHKFHEPVRVDQFGWAKHKGKWNGVKEMEIRLAVRQNIGLSLELFISCHILIFNLIVLRLASIAKYDL